MTTPWQPLADRTLAALRALLGDDLVAVWVHGSAALGGFVVGRSDLDVLVVVHDGVERDWREVGRGLVETAGQEPLELSVVRRRLAEHPAPPWPFALHVAVEPPRHPRVELDDGRGDVDLLLHLAVARQSGIALLGPSPAETVGEIDRDDVVSQLVEELQWGVDEADEAYAVLNACRALRYAETGELVSKVAGGAWALERLPEHHVVVERALDAQQHGVRLGSATMIGRALVVEVMEELTWG